EEVVKEESSCCSSKQEEVVKEESSCCASKQEEVIKEESSCCSSDEKKSLSTTEEAGLEKENKSSKNINSESFTSRLAKGLKYSFVNLLRDISPTLLFAFVLGGIISTVLSEELVSHYFHGGISGYIGIVLLSVPMYICATSSTPIAAAFMMKGMSPGTALVFLMAGPATNFTSLSILSKIFGAKSIASYLTVIILSSICFGLLTDYLILKQLFTVQLSLQHMHEHNMSASPIQVALTVIFMVPVFYYSFQAFQEKYLKS
ncbi:permease, partial [bacterium]|nr:permease [bacterium]